MNITHSIGRRIRGIALAITLCGIATLSTGCNDAGRGAFLGGGLGAGLGAIIGHQSGEGGEGALIGAGAGALLGYIVGNESDKSRHESYHDYYGPSGRPTSGGSYTVHRYPQPVYREYHYIPQPYYRTYHYHRRPYRSSVSFTFSDCPW